MGLRLHGQFKRGRSSCRCFGVRIVLRNHFCGSALRRQTSQKASVISVFCRSVLSLPFFGMSIVLLSASPATALCGYIVMGLELAPVVPTIFSLSGKMQRNFSFRGQQFHRYRRLWRSVGRTSDAWMDRLSFIARHCLVLGVGFLCIGFCDLIDSSAPERPTESQRLIGAVNSSLILR